MDEAENCDRLGLMNKGRLIALRTPEQLKEESEKISGKLIQIKALDFRKVYNILASYFRFRNFSSKNSSSGSFCGFYNKRQ